MMNIDKLMDELLERGVSLEAVQNSYKEAEARKKDSAEIEVARANVMQSLRKYITKLYGAADEQIMNEFEQTLKGLEKFAKAPNKFSVSMSNSDDKKLDEWLKGMKW